MIKKKSVKVSETESLFSETLDVINCLHCEFCTAPQRQKHGEGAELPSCGSFVLLQHLMWGPSDAVKALS